MCLRLLRTRRIRICFTKKSFQKIYHKKGLIYTKLESDFKDFRNSPVHIYTNDLQAETLWDRGSSNKRKKATSQSHPQEHISWHSRYDEVPNVFIKSSGKLKVCRSWWRNRTIAKTDYWTSVFTKDMKDQLFRAIRTQDLDEDRITLDDKWMQKSTKFWKGSHTFSCCGRVTCWHFNMSKCTLLWYWILWCCWTASWIMLCSCSNSLFNIIWDYNKSYQDFSFLQTFWNKNLPCSALDGLVHFHKHSASDLFFFAYF